MKECRYCGTKYDDVLSNCPSCGANLVVTEEETLEQEQFLKKDIENTEQSQTSGNTHTGKLLGLVALAVVAIVVFAAVMSNNKSEQQTSGEKHEYAASGTSASVSQNNSFDETESKQAYEIGKTYLERGEYEKAIKELKKVQSASEYYVDAQSMISSASTEYEAAVLAEARELNSANDFSRSITLLRNALGVLNQSTDIAIELDNAQESYSVTVAKESKQAYFDSGSESATQVVKEGLRIIPEDTRLKQLEELYQSVQDTPAEKMQYDCDGSDIANYFETSATDSYDTVHRGKLLSLLASDWWDGYCPVEFLLYENYSRFSADTFVRQMSENSGARLEFYCDDVLVYNTGEVGRKYHGESIALDLEGVYSFKIKVYGWSGPGDLTPVFYLENPTFHKTLTESEINQIIGNI